VSTPGTEKAPVSGSAMADVSEEFGPSTIRLSAWQWAVVGGLVVAVVLLMPWIAQRREAFTPWVDYRHPYAYSEDYWLYERYSRYASARYPVAVLGDSVVWGHYVEPQGTLSHFLNQQAGKPLFANLGLDGIRPMALAGLVQYYCRDLTGHGVVLHLNPLWMSSPDTDLRPPGNEAGAWPRVAARARQAWWHRPPPEEEGVRINHVGLIPQVSSLPRGYDPSLREVTAITLERHLPYAAWLRHMRMLYFENLGLQSWTLGNPYRNPLHAVTLELPQPEDRPEGSPVPWSQGGVEQQDFPWVPLEQSYQWERFRKTVEILRARHNQVFVLVGPMNTHLMTDGSAQRYGRLKGEMEAWLTAAGVPCYSPPPLPSDLYADASHPLKAGYAELAKELYNDGAFRDWLTHNAQDHG